MSKKPKVLRVLVLPDMLRNDDETRRLPGRQEVLRPARPGLGELDRTVCGSTACLGSDPFLDRARHHEVGRRAPQHAEREHHVLGGEGLAVAPADAVRSFTVISVKSGL